MSIESTNVKFFIVVLIKCCSKSFTVFSLPKPVLWYQAKPKLKVCPFLFIVFFFQITLLYRQSEKLDCSCYPHTSCKIKVLSLNEY